MNSGLPTNVYYYRHALAASGTTVYLAASSPDLQDNERRNGLDTPVPTNVGAYGIAVSPQNASIIYASISSVLPLKNRPMEEQRGARPRQGCRRRSRSTISRLSWLIQPMQRTCSSVDKVPNAAFVARSSTAREAGLTWSTYLDSSVNNRYCLRLSGYGVATNGSNVFVTGYAYGQGLPITSTLILPQTGPQYSAFVTEISDATAACSTTLSPSTMFVSQFGGTVSFDVLAPSGCTWTASTNQPWATVAFGASGTGVGVVTVTTTSNSTAATRTALLTVGSQTATINQPKNSCSYSLDQSVYAASASGGAIPVVLTATAGCPWSVTNNYPSVISVGNAAGTGSGTITLTVARNTGLDPLNFNLQVGNTSISLIQAGTCLSLSASGASTPLGGGTGSVNVIATYPGCQWTASSSASWLTVTSSTNGNTNFQNGTGNGTVTWSSQPDVGAARTGVLPIAGLPFTITQGVVSGATTTSLGVSGNNPSIFGQSVTLTASVAPAAPGSVTFYNGTTVLGSGLSLERHRASNDEPAFFCRHGTP